MTISPLRGSSGPESIEPKGSSETSGVKAKIHLPSSKEVLSELNGVKKGEKNTLSPYPYDLQISVTAIVVELHELSNRKL